MPTNLTAPLTARELGETIVSPDRELQQAIERIHHWTREGLLTPIGEKNPGRGRVRFYSREAIVPARILNTLADFGLGVGLMTPAVAKAVLQLGENAEPHLKEHRENGINVFLCVHMGRALGPTPLVSVSEKQIITLAGGEPVTLFGDDLRDQLADAVLTIDLTRLLSEPPNAFVVAGRRFER